VSTVSRCFRAGLIAAGFGLALAGTAVAASAPSASDHGRSCFFVSQWRGWKSPSPDVLYLGVNMHDVYKVELSAGSSQLQWPDSRLISQIRGSSTICDALDLDLAVSDGHGFSQPLIAKSIVKLTPEEVAAIPKKFNPN
jgi:hypothetical protein